MQYAENLFHVSKKSLATALEVSVSTLYRDLSLLREFIDDEPELDYRPGEQGYPVSTAKYLYLLRLLRKKKWNKERAVAVIKENSFKGVDRLIEEYQPMSARPFYELINKSIRSIEDEF